MRKRKDARRKNRGAFWGYGLIAALFIYVTKAFESRNGELTLGKPGAKKDTVGKRWATPKEIAEAIAGARHDRLFFDPDTEFQFTELTEQL